MVSKFGVDIKIQFIMQKRNINSKDVWNHFGNIAKLVTLNRRKS